MNHSSSAESVAFDYDYDIDLSGDSAPAKVIRMTGSNARVLDLGAGAGSISAVLKKSYGCTVHAAEYARASLDRLQDRVDRAIPCDLNSHNWEEQFLGEHYDVIILADVLEHLYDPLKTLRQAVRIMQPSTQLILSIPHVHHMALTAKYFTNDFSYLPYGLLDKTHIRFFGIKNIDDLINQAGLKAREIDFVLRLPEETEFVEDWRQVPAHVKMALRHNPAGYVYQVVAKLGLSADKPLTVMQALRQKAGYILLHKRIPSHFLVKRCKSLAGRLLPASLKNKLRP